MELFKTYTQFTELRAELIEYATKRATYTEDRDGEKVRPLTVIRTDEELRKVNSMIAKWHLLADQLSEGDPVRYSRTSVLFSPEPKVLHNQKEVFIKVNAATSTRKISRLNILKRLKDLRRVSYLSQGNSAQTRKYAKEITFFNKETEEVYRIRSEGYTEIVLLHRTADEDELTKTRVPFAGVFVFDPDRKCQIFMPEHGREYIRSDKLANMGIKPIPCSLNIRGVLLRESDIIRAKSKNAQQRLAAQEEKNKAIAEKRANKQAASREKQLAEQLEKEKRAEQRAIAAKERAAAKASAIAERARKRAEEAKIATAQAEANRLQKEAEKLKRAQERKQETERKKAEKKANAKAEREALKAERKALKAQEAAAKKSGTDK